MQRCSLPHPRANVGYNLFTLRGFEPAQEGEKSVAYLHEWAVKPGRER